MSADKAKLLELAERVEALTGPDRKMDIAIWMACVANAQQLELVEKGREYHGDSEADFRADRMSDGKRYTGSLDAAMSLVPKGHLWTLDSFEGPRSTAGVWKPQTGWLIYPCDAPKTATPALALTAACLRAHAEQAS